MPSLRWRRKGRQTQERGLGLTYRELADALHADESTLHRWRNGDSTPSPVFMDRLGTLGELRRKVDQAFVSATIRCHHSR